MKKLLNILAAAALVAGLASCEKIQQEDAFSTAPVAPEIYAHNDILITNNTMDEAVTFAWSAYRFLDKGLEYTLYATYDGEYAALGTTTEQYMTWTKSEFRTLLYEKLANLPENDIFSILMYVSVPNGGKELKSSTVRVSVYAAGDAVPVVISEVMEPTVLDPADPEATVEVISWEPARLVYGETVTYDVFVSLADPATKADEDTPAEPVKVKLTAEPIETTSLVVTVDQLNEAIVSAGGVEAAENDVVFDVVAYCESLPNGISTASANVAVTTYLATFADELYVPGSHQGWAPATAPTLKHSKVTKGFYQGFVNLTTADGSDVEFKFCPEPDWGNDFGGTVEVNAAGSGDCATALGTVGVADNIKVPSGVYYIELNKKLNTIMMVQMNSLSLIGSAVGDFGWGQDVDLEYNDDNQTFTAVTTFAAGEFKMRFNHNWDMSLGGSNEAGYSLHGGNIAVDKTGEYKIVVDASVVPFSIKYVNTSFPDQLYVPGSHNGWDHSATVFAGNGEGQYEGFANLGGEWGFKFTPTPNWDNGEWGFVTGSEPTEEESWKVYQLTSDGAGNILEGSEVTYYKAIVDLAELKLQLTPVTSVGIIGGFSGNSWSSDMYPLTYDAETDSWKAKEVEIIKGTEWKFRMNEAWTINLGGSLDNLVQDGSNIVEAEGAIYDVQLFLNTTPYHAVLTKTGDSDYVDTKEGPWSLIGVIGGSNWDTDFDMEKDGTMFTCKNVSLTAGDGFKLRFNHEWNFNRGAVESGDPYTVTIGSAVAVANNGSNMAVPESGSYDVYYDADKETVTIVAAGTVIKDVWSLIGVLNGTSWDTDFDMTEEGGLLVTKNVTLSGGEFKIRKNHDWAVSYGNGSTAAAVGVPTVLTSSNGGNMAFADGTYDVYFNPAAETVYVMPAGKKVWSLIGTLCGTNWDTDFDLTYNVAASVYSTTVTVSDGEQLKLRANHGWDDNRGGTLSGGTGSAVVNGDNITVSGGTITVTYDPVNETITIQ